MSTKHFKRLFYRYYKKERIISHVYDFSVDYDSIAIDDILDIHRYLMKKNNMI